MNAEIIAVGSELLTPSRVDTNSLYLTEKLNDLGVEVVTKTIVGDDRDRLARITREALGRSEIVLLTGGLGPTEDDVTREAVAEALGRKLIFHQELCQAIQERFAKMGRRMAEINRRQAYVIEGAEVLPNHNGTAPGQWIAEGAKVIALLPGPPAELQPMFEAECLPRLKKLCPPLTIRVRVYRVAGMPESDLDQLISPVYRKYQNPTTTILAAPGDIQIHLRARAENPGEAEGLLEELGSQIEALLGDRIYSKNGEALEAVVGAKLRAAGATLSVAESCTGGMLGEKITAVAGSSAYFAGGFLVYNDEMKSRLLGIPSELICQHGAVSQPVAEAMAEGAKARTGSTWALSVTGVAGPSGGSPGSPVGTVIIGVAGPEGVRSFIYRFPGNRERVRAMAVQTALDLLRKALG